MDASKCSSLSLSASGSLQGDVRRSLLGCRGYFRPAPNESCHQGLLHGCGGCPPRHARGRKPPARGCCQTTSSRPPHRLHPHRPPIIFLNSNFFQLMTRFFLREHGMAARLLLVLDLPHARVGRRVASNRRSDVKGHSEDEVQLRLRSAARPSRLVLLLHHTPHEALYKSALHAMCERRRGCCGC